MRLGRLDLNLLVALDTLLEERSVSASARLLNLSQPALSGALGRLRDFFEDDLLVSSGRQMFLTPKAESLKQPVRDVLTLIQAKITTPNTFDPSTSDRRFLIIASDFVYNVLLADVMREARRLAPGIHFEIMATDKWTHERLEKGEADLVITLPSYNIDGHPRLTLFQDEHAVISWSEGKYAKQLTREDFEQAGHAVTVFGPSKHPAYTETYFSQQGLVRNIEVSVPNFSALPEAVIGTDRIATMYRHHAAFFARFFPITIHNPPLDIPHIAEEAQWHVVRDKDEGLRWLLDLFQSRIKELGLPTGTPQQD